MQEFYHRQYIIAFLKEPKKDPKIRENYPSMPGACSKEAGACTSLAMSLLRSRRLCMWCLDVRVETHTEGLRFRV